jgi:hypothetical protein
MRRFGFWALLFALFLPLPVLAQGLDITRGQRGLVQLRVHEHQFIAGTERLGTVGQGGSVAAKLLTGLTVGAPAGTTARTYTFTRTGTTGAAVHPPPYPARLQFFVADKDANSVVTCTGGTVVGIDPYGVSVSETVSGTIDDSPSSSPVLTKYAYSDVVKITISGCVLTSGTVAADQILVAVSDWVYVGQKIRNSGNIHKVCGWDQDAAPGVGVTECFTGAQINTEKTWSSIFHAASNTLDMATLFATDTQLFSTTFEGFLIETFPFPVSR